MTFMMTFLNLYLILMTGMTALMTLDHRTDLEGTERIHSRAYDTTNTFITWRRSEYTCEKESGKKPDSLDHLTFIRRQYRKGIMRNRLTWVWCVHFLAKSFA